MRVERATAAHPLIRAVEDFPIHVVLALVGRPVPPANGSRTAVAFQLGVLALIGHDLTLDVIHNPGLTAAFEGIQNPPQKRTSLVIEADPSECVHGEGRIADPCISVVPVPHAAHGCWQRRRWRGDDGAAAPVVAEFQRDGGTAYESRFWTRVAKAGHPPVPCVGSVLQERFGLKAMMAMQATPGENEVQSLTRFQMMRRT